MPIEFRCTSCEKLLRTADDTAGKQARCPHCDALLWVPRLSVEPGPAAEPGLPVEPGPPAESNPFAGLPPAEPAFGAAPPGSASRLDGDNPYQSPLAAPAGYQAPSGPRSGPPWERDGASFASFFETVKLMYSQLIAFFQDMRREGGLGAPLGFGVAGGMVGMLAAMLMQIGMQALIGLAAGGGGQADFAAAMASFGAVMVGTAVCIAPVALIVGMFVSAGVYHLMLMLLGGANQPFETTFRVVAYTTGATSLLLLIPMCGQYINLIVQIIFCIFGLTYAHETTGLKAVGAVLLPIVVCVCGAVAIGISMVALVANQAAM